MKLADLAGKAVEGALRELPAAIKGKIEELAYLALKKSYDAALWSDRKSFRNSSWIESILAWANSEAWHRAAVAATGALGGIGGAPTTVVELPVTTALILHSVQQIAISYGKDQADLECASNASLSSHLAVPWKRTRIQSLAFGASVLGSGGRRSVN